MSLPPLLLERLKRRRIIQEATADSGPSDSCSGVSAPIESESLQQEPSAASSSADREQVADHQAQVQGCGNQRTHEQNQAPSECERTKDDDLATNNQGSINLRCSDEESALGCPNKYDIHHKCEKFCRETYGTVSNPMPSVQQRKHLAFILKTFPLSNDWTIVYDPGVKTFYFWNMITNLVSWLPPTMGGLPSMSADQIRSSMRPNDQSDQSVDRNQEPIGT